MVLPVIFVKHPANIDCGAHGNCSGGTCICESGAYTGDRCQNYDACYGVHCGVHGTCSGGTCICNPGYSGDNCGTQDLSDTCPQIDGFGCFMECGQDDTYIDDDYDFCTACCGCLPGPHGGC